MLYLFELMEKSYEELIELKGWVLDDIQTLRQEGGLANENAALMQEAYITVIDKALEAVKESMVEGESIEEGNNTKMYLTNSQKRLAKELNKVEGGYKIMLSDGYIFSENDGRVITVKTQEQVKKALNGVKVMSATMVATRLRKERNGGYFLTINNRGQKVYWR